MQGWAAEASPAGLLNQVTHEDLWFCSISGNTRDGFLTAGKKVSLYKLA